MFKKQNPNSKESSRGGSMPQISADTLRQQFSASPDIGFSEIIVGGNNRLRLTLAFVDGLTSSQQIDDYILKPLVQERALTGAASQRELLDSIMHGALYHFQRKPCRDFAESVSALLSGSVLLIFDDLQQAVAFDVKGFEKRGVSETTSENVLKGSKESFIEVLRVNTALVRRRIQSPDLEIRQLKIGRRSGTVVSVAYLAGVANSGTVDAVMKRLEAIDIDGISSAGQIEAFLQGRKNSIFPQTIYTERVDKFCGNLLEGRIGIIIDGMPTAYITPVDFTAFLQAPEDYALSTIASTMLRILRFACAFAALILPALYVAITTFHQEMIPTKLAIAIISNKQGVPFPSYLEVLLMLLAFEVLLEAGLRLPQAIGSAVSIVGALVVGQAAITAGILSPGVVIVIAAAGVSGFVIPSQDFSNTIRICRIALVLLAIIGGLFTVTLGLILILYRMSSLEIFGVPYLSTFAAMDGKRMFTDTIIRAPWHKAKKRPVNLGVENETRQGGDEIGD